MKCLVLTGGAGNHMWPISRKNYPKQFVYLDGKHSMFQETILRNLPFCDEFLIFSSTSYKNIIQGQMQPFTGLNYRCFYEEEGRLTAPPLIFASMLVDPDEDILVVSTDNFVSNENYKEIIVEGRRMASEGNIVALGVEYRAPSLNVAFFKEKPEGGVDYILSDDSDVINNVVKKGYLMDTGILMGKACVFIEEFDKYRPQLLKHTKKVFSRIDNVNKINTIPKEFVEDVDRESIGHALIINSDRVKIFKCNFKLRRIRSLEALSDVLESNPRGRVIKNNCDNVSVINFTDDQIVVSNELSDVVIVNMADAVYVSKKGSTNSIKSIIYSESNVIPEKVINESPMYYTLWGYRENLQLEKNSWVRRLTVYPGSSLKRHKHNSRTETWTVVKGEASVFLENKWYKLNVGESIHIKKGQFHQLVNNTFENIVIMETAVSEILDTEDDKDTKYVYSNRPIHDNIIKMIPSVKETIWGGTKLIDDYNKVAKGNNIAESWEISAHPNGQSIVATGKYKGTPFDEYINIMGRDILGWKSQVYDRFPVLVKLIDARYDLSVQVHPDDDYALANENQYGKNEMWYIVEAEENARIYCGFNNSVTKDEIKKRTADNTLTEIMKSIPVKKGDTYFIPTGTVHAIGKGILICEIQQNSDVTYRLYDYGRKDKSGKERELHIDKALDVLVPDETLQIPVELKENSVGEIICKCKYFTVERYDCSEKTIMWSNQSSFTAVVIVSGSGSIKVGNDKLEFVKGESFFIPAGIKAITIMGKAEILTVRI